MEIPKARRIASIREKLHFLNTLRDPAKLGELVLVLVIIWGFMVDTRIERELMMENIGNKVAIWIQILLEATVKFLIVCGVVYSVVMIFTRWWRGRGRSPC